MIALHPTVRLPLLILGALSILVGAAVLVLGLTGGAPVGLLLRGAAALAIGIFAMSLGRRAGRGGAGAS